MVPEPFTFRRLHRGLVVSLAAVALAFAGLVAFSGASQAATQGPCDIYAAGGTPCVAAHSTTRALFASYNGPLYQVQRLSDSALQNIGVLSAGGVANAAAQDSFCAGTTCTITRVYDQTGNSGNTLVYQGPGGTGGADTAATANTETLTVGGQKAYALYINPGNSYFAGGSGVPTGSSPEGEYMVTSGAHVNNGCCFDYGNSETDHHADGNGAMDAINFSTSCWFGGCSGTGPWVQADLENGLFSGGSTTWNPGQVAETSHFVTAMLKNNGTTQMALKGANAQSGSLTQLYSGALPTGYNPMHKQGAIILGSGGDCCQTNNNDSAGTFYEGAMVQGYPSDATDAAVQANIAAAGYVTGTTTPFTRGARLSLKATTSCCTTDYLQHNASDDKVVIAPVSSGSSATDRGDATWIVRPGLANSNCVSFESANASGKYLRHSGFQLYLNPNDGTTLFAADATFCPQPGNSGTGYSLQSLNYPAKYIRHYAFTAYIASNGGTNAWDATSSWAQDTSWLAAAPWS
ncbi:alpha-L-arabinofuranosidase B [Streptomyces sp. NBC_00474]|uniref:alpha-L-arabinofuranosidase B n=1 Tax=unclassified Streptomyces TaxID=2593676 RepID=UPI00224CA0A4|nr:alpha-L-arabinofuranosidase B [Streptomyces sp. NBC_00474]MCX5052221.1 alpha-L-arabinofuranosidase B [Streptomyces sp. NBC_00474]